MKTILSAFKNFGRKDRARSRSEPCVHDLRADSPSVTKLSSSDLKYRGKLSVKEREILSQKMAYCKQMGEFNFEEEVKDEETSSCHMYSDDEKEWNYGENAKNSENEKALQKPRKKYKTSNLFTLTAQGRDFSCCTFDRDEASNLLYLSSFGPMEKWNMRLQTGTRKLWVGDRLVSINGCVVRSLGALKELLLTHDEAFIEFMFMKLDHSRPSKPKKFNSKKDKWSAVEGPRNQSTKTLTPANSTLSLDLFSPCSTEPGSVLYSNGCGEGEERSATRSEDHGSARAASRVVLGMSLGRGRGLLGEDIIAPPKEIEGFCTTLKESSSVPFSVGLSAWKDDSEAPPDSEVDEVPLQRYELEGQRKSESPGACSDEKTHELPETEGEGVGVRRRRHRSLDGSCSEANGARRRHAILPRGGRSGAAARIRLQPLEDGSVKFLPKKAGRPGPPNHSSDNGDCIVEQPGAAPLDYRVPLAKSKSSGISVRPGVSRRPKTTQIRLVKRQPRLRQKEASPELDERDIFGDVRSPLGMLRASMFI